MFAFSGNLTKGMVQMEISLSSQLIVHSKTIGAWIVFKKGLFHFLRSAHTRALVPVTSPCNKPRGLVLSCELAIFSEKSSRRD